MGSWFVPPDPGRWRLDCVAAARAGGWRRSWRIWLSLNVIELTWTALLIGLILFINLFTAR